MQMPDWLIEHAELDPLTGNAQRIGGIGADGLKALIAVELRISPPRFARGLEIVGFAAVGVEILGFLRHRTGTS